MQITPTTNYATRNFNYNPTFKSETTSGRDSHIDKKPFYQHDPLDEDEFLSMKLSEDDDDTMIPYDEHPPSYSNTDGCMRGLGAIATALIAAGTMLITQGINEKDDQYQDSIKSIQAEDIQKDTFTIKDMNNDKVPDLILYKKDGTPIVVDFANQKITEETKNLKSL